MKARWTRSVLLALMLLALPPGATLAACLQAGPGECCCSDMCPKPAEPRIDAPSCCEISDGATIPPTVPVVVTPAPADPVPTGSVELVERTIVCVAPTSVVKVPLEPAVRRPVALFTLHAAFLI